MTTVTATMGSGTIRTPPDTGKSYLPLAEEIERQQRAFEQAGRGVPEELDSAAPPQVAGIGVLPDGGEDGGGA